MCNSTKSDKKSDEKAANDDGSPKRTTNEAQKSAAQIAALLATAIAENTFGDSAPEEQQEDCPAVAQPATKEAPTVVVEINGTKRPNENGGDEDNVKSKENDRSPSRVSTSMEKRQRIESKTDISVEPKLPTVIRDWKVSDVVNFLTDIELGHVVQTFRDNGIDGLMLLELEEQDLRSELGLTMLQAKKITKRLAPHR